MTLIVLAVSLALAAGVGAGTATAAGGKKLVEGTVYDATCVAVCQPECPPPPHCGPIPAPKSRSDAICAQAAIVCPLYRIAPGGSIYTGEGSLVNVRKRGSTTVIARLPVVEGHFSIRLAPGEYVFHPYLAEEQCWSADAVVASVIVKSQSPVPVAMTATNRCVMHAL